MTLLLAMLALAGAGQATEPTAEPFRVACGDRYCALSNRTAEFRATERGLSLERIAGFAPGGNVILRLSGRGDGAIARVFGVRLGESAASERSPRNPSRELGRRSLTSLIEALSAAAQIRIDDCGSPPEGAIALNGACIVTLHGLDRAVIEARTRLRMARRNY